MSIRMMYHLIIMLTSAIVLASSSLAPATSSSSCRSSMLGCLCTNVENVSAIHLEPCCVKRMPTLIITGPLVVNLSLDISRSNCSSTFKNLVIRDTAIVKFWSPFKGLNNVTQVNIEKNPNLTDFHKLVFEEISPNLISILVEYNSFRSISRKTFANLSKLTDLRLSDNKIGFIDDQSFADLTVLNTLYMNNNLLTILSSDVFFGLQSLSVLSLFNNPLQEPKSGELFKHLTNLRHLLMSHSTNVDLPGLNQLPDRVFFSMKRLRALNISSIKITNLTSLTFYGLNELESLDLQGNRLTVIPPGSLQQVPKIVSINLSRNQLYCLLPETFHSLPMLMNLDLSQNELTYISEDVFKGLLRLQSLDLAENNIYVIENNAFVSLQKLMILKVNAVYGMVKNVIQGNFTASPLAKLRNTTKIIGLIDYYGVTQGLNQPADVEVVRKNVQCPVASAAERDYTDTSALGSRKYLLIIVGICVVFLMIAFTIIMTYRAWSKRRMSELSVDVECEKQEMLVSKNQALNGDVEKADPNRQSINGTSVTEKSKDDSADASKQRHSHIKTSLADDRCHSDDESALTPLGVL